MFHVYILLCADNTFYTGLTRHLAQRIDEHTRGKSRYTQSRLPIKLVHREEFAHEVEAVAREKQIKNWSYGKKASLVKSEFHEIRILAKKKFIR